MCIVEEDDIALAILRLVEIEKCVVEGAGASGLAACLSGQLDSRLKGKKLVIVKQLLIQASDFNFVYIF